MSGPGARLPATVAFLWLVRGALTVSVAAISILAVVPDSGGPDFLPWDKAKHAFAFYVLAVLAAASVPSRPLVWPAAAVAGYGVLIELVQPLFGREGSGLDLVADAVGMAAALAPLALARWRRRFRAAA